MLKYTREQLEELQHARLTELANYVGGYPHLAKMLDQPSSTVQGWAARGRISKAGAMLVESHPTLKEKFDAKYLRPDL